LKAIQTGQENWRVFPYESLRTSLDSQSINRLFHQGHTTGVCGSASMAANGSARRRRNHNAYETFDFLGFFSCGQSMNRAHQCRSSVMPIGEIVHCGAATMTALERFTLDVLYIFEPVNHRAQAAPNPTKVPSCTPFFSFFSLHAVQRLWR
jgi:hypothetical protein